MATDARIAVVVVAVTLWVEGVATRQGTSIESLSQGDGIRKPR